MARFAPRYEAAEALETLFGDSESDIEPRAEWDLDDNSDDSDMNVEGDMGEEDDSGESDEDNGDSDEDTGPAGPVDDDGVDAHTCIHAMDGIADNTNWTTRNDENSPPPFTAQPGLTTPAPDDAGVDYYVHLLFQDDLYELLVRETNRYAAQRLGTMNLTPNARARQWKDVTVPEMRTFLALYFLSGLNWSITWSTTGLLT